MNYCIKKQKPYFLKKASFGERVEFNPMSAFERRIIHLAVADAGKEVVSESVGEGSLRRVVVRCIENAEGISVLK